MSRRRISCGWRSEMVQGGVDILQLRAKAFIPDDVRWFAEQIHPLTLAAGVPLVINDFPEVAADVGAEGVHLGQDDIPVERAREVAGYRTVIGKSTHSVAQAMAAAAEDTDYIGFGPIFCHADEAGLHADWRQRNPDGA